MSFLKHNSKWQHTIHLWSAKFLTLLLTIDHISRPLLIFSCQRQQNGALIFRQNRLPLPTTGVRFFVPMCSNNRKIGFAQRWAYPKLGSFVLINVIWVSRVRTRNNKYMGIFVRCKVDFLSRQPWRLWILMLGCTLAPVGRVFIGDDDNK